MQNIIDYIISVLEFCYNNFYNEPLEIQLIWLCIPLFILLTVGFIITLFILRFNHQLKKTREKKWKPLIETQIINYITQKKESSNNAKILHDLKTLTKLKFQKEIAIYSLMGLSGNVTGETKTNIETLFTKLNLEKLVFKKIDSKYWQTKVLGIRIITQMNYQHHVEEKLTPYINDKNEILRGEVLMALVKLKGVKGLNHLDALVYNISEWQQIEIIDALTWHKNITIPDLTNWLQSNNTSIVNIALKIAEIYAQIQYSEHIVSLLNHRDYQVRAKCRQLVKYYKIKEASPVLLHLCQQEQEDEEELLEIIETIQHLGINFNYMDPKENHKKNITQLERKQQFFLQLN